MALHTSAGMIYTARTYLFLKEHRKMVRFDISRRCEKMPMARIAERYACQEPSNKSGLKSREDLRN